MKVLIVLTLLLVSCSVSKKNNLNPRSVSSVDSMACLEAYDTEAQKLRKTSKRKKLYAILKIGGGVGLSALDSGLLGPGPGMLTGIVMYLAGVDDFSEGQKSAARSLFAGNVSNLISEIQSGVRDGPFLKKFTEDLNYIIYEWNNQTKILFRIKYRELLKGRKLEINEVERVVSSMINSNKICTKERGVLNAKEFVEVIYEALQN